MARLNTASGIVSVLALLPLAAPLVDSFVENPPVAQSAPHFEISAYDAGGNGTTAVVVRDVDGDGTLDLVAANPFACVYPFCIEGNVGVLRGRGDGTFHTPVTYGTRGAQTGGVDAGDVNGDGLLDIVAANNCSSQERCTHATVAVLLAVETGGFETAVVYDLDAYGAYGAGSIALADLDTDGDLDVAVASKLKGIVVLAGNGDGTFGPPLMHLAGSEYGRSLAVGDLNANGIPDIVAGNTCRQYPYSCTNLLAVLVGIGNGTFQPAVEYDSGDEYESIVSLADVNGDGTLDLVVANQSGPALGVLIGNGDATFQPVTTYPLSGTNGRGITVADLNGDARPDAIVSIGYHTNRTTGALGILLGNGDGTFQPGLLYESGGVQTIGSASTGDFNDDGRVDIVSPQYGPFADGSVTNGVLGVLLNGVSCTAPLAVTVSTSPAALWPPNGRTVQVSVSGTVASQGSGCTASAAEFSVTDEYGTVQPAGPISLNPDGSYIVAVPLEAARRGNDMDGRSYSVMVTATGAFGTSSAVATVVVPHSKGG